MKYIITHKKGRTEQGPLFISNKSAPRSYGILWTFDIDRALTFPSRKEAAIFKSEAQILGEGHPTIKMETDNGQMGL